MATNRSESEHSTESRPPPAGKVHVLSRFRSFRLSVRAATIALVVCVLCATGLISYATDASSDRHADARVQAEDTILSASLYEDALGAAYNEWVTVVVYFSTRDDVYLQRFADSRLKVEQALTELRAQSGNDAAEIAHIDSLIARHAGFADVDQQVIDAIRANDLGRALELASDSGLTQASDEFLGDLRASIDRARAELQAGQVEQQNAGESALKWSLGIGATCAVLVLLVCFAGHNGIGRPLLRASEATRAIARGELSVRVPVSGPTELANLAEDVNSMADALIKRSDELNAYLSKDLEQRTADLERANADLLREVDDRRRAEEALARALEAERELEKQLRHQAFHDPLTGLANRARFMDRLEHALERAARSRRSVAILFMDIDDFKSVNDSLGHSAGDRLLMHVAERIAQHVRPGDTAARFGGDEFAMLLEEGVVSDDAIIVAERVTAALREPTTLEEKEVFVRASIGIAIADAGDAPEEILRRADVAMYVAKAQGKGRFAIYDESMEESIVGRLELAGELQRAVERQEFVIHYQPSVSLIDSSIVGVEALLRWQHPMRGLLYPADFITVAEETGLILPIGAWVLREACVQAHRWQLEFGSDPPLTLAVNISARQVHQPGLRDIVAEALRDSGLPAASLVLEITETLMMQDAELSIERLAELKSLGIRLAIDDFGTGYSSLSYLRKFPVDILKIDKSFVDGVSRQGKEQELAQSIIELGQTLKLEIVAEGVEHPEQLGWLRSRKCDMGQGFFFSEAVEPDELTRLLRDGGRAERDVA
jgi:diguanylate cyclase (GGDEF)-like protein